MSDGATIVLALAAVAGAWAAHPLPLVPAAGAVAVALVLRRPVLLMITVALAASALGARAWHGLRPPSTGAWTGVVTLVGDPSDVNGALRVDVRIGGKRVEAWARGASARALNARLAGERVTLRGELQPVPADARDRLARRHVGARMSVAGVGAWHAGDPPSRLANALRRTLLDGARSLPPVRRALFAGFVLGDDRDQPAEVVDDFRASGLSHLLVVSGENVAFVLALVGPLVTRLRMGARLLAGLLVLVLFGVVTRWEPSVLRAETMAAIALLATTLGRPVSTLRMLALAVSGLVLVDPMLVGSVGFLLSIGACCGIALLGAPLTAALPGPRPVASALGVTLAAQIGVLPFMMPVFHDMPVAAVPANLLAVPVAGPLMIWGMAVGVPAGLAGGPAARLVHVPTDIMVGWVAGVARWSAAAPLGQLRTPHVVALGAAAGLGLVAHRLRRPRGVALAVAAGVVVAVLPAAAVLRPAPVDGRSIVVGARLWRRGGASVLVVDDLQASPTQLLSALHGAGVLRLDVVVVTRPGPTASEHVQAVLQRFAPGLLLAPPGNRLGAGAVVPRAGSRVATGGLVVELGGAAPQLSVRVGPARGPPGSVGAACDCASARSSTT